MLQLRRTLFKASFLLLLVGLTGAPAVALAQESPTPGADGIQLSREELEARLENYSQTAESSAFSAEMRSIARREADLIRDRLDRGDFQTGDQVTLVVEGEEDLTGTFTVDGDRSLPLPVIGSIPLDGVLRSELEPYLTQELGRYIRDPQVRARALFRVTVTGAVGRPGFYVVPAESLITDVLMTAGGPSGSADLNGIRVEREGEPIWRAKELQPAITEGRTLDELSLAAGDQIIVPNKQRSIGGKVLAGVSAAASITYLVYRLSRIF